MVCLRTFGAANFPRKLVLLWVSNPGPAYVCSSVPRPSRPPLWLVEPATPFTLLEQTEEVPPLRARSCVRKKANPRCFGGETILGEYCQSSQGKVPFTKDLFKGKLCSTVFGLFPHSCLRKYFPLEVQLDLYLEVQWRKCVWIRGVFSVYALMQ